MKQKVTNFHFIHYYIYRARLLFLFCTFAVTNFYFNLNSISYETENRTSTF